MKVYVVTGAGHFPGIGSCTAKRAFDQGHQVVVNGRNFDPAWQDLANANPDRIKLIQGSVLETSVQNQIVAAAQEWGRMDVLVHNAALRHSNFKPSRQDWFDEYAINVVAPHELTELAQPLLDQSQGSVVMIGSRSGLKVNKNMAISYALAKAAMHHMVRELSTRLAPNIRVNGIAPGLTETNRIKEKYEQNETFKINVPKFFYDVSFLDRLVDVENIVDTVEYLSNNASITGQIIHVDCGASV